MSGPDHIFDDGEEENDFVERITSGNDEGAASSGRRRVDDDVSDDEDDNSVSRGGSDIEVEGDDGLLDEDGGERDGDEEERYAREEAEEARDRMAAEGGQLTERAVDNTPGGGEQPQNAFEFANDDVMPEHFNALLRDRNEQMDTLRRVQAAMGGAASNSSSNLTILQRLSDTPLGVPIRPPMSDYHLQIHDHLRCPTTRRQFVPGPLAIAANGDHSDALACKIPGAKIKGGFPHYLERKPEEEGGHTVASVITNNNISIIGKVHAVNDVEGAVRIHERELLEKINFLLHGELEAEGAYPLTELKFRLRLIFADKLPTDPDAEPLGTGPDKAWEKVHNVEIEGEREVSQLLNPPESKGYYTRAMLNGIADWSKFVAQTGVTSFLCKKVKRPFFKFVIEPADPTVRAKCLTLTKTTDPFWLSAKFCADGCAQTWVESAVAGGPAVRYNRKRRCPDDEDDAAPAQQAGA